MHKYLERHRFVLVSEHTYTEGGRRLPGAMKTMGMRGSKPIGNVLWAPLFIRVALGFYLLLLGVWGFSESAAVSTRVEQFAGISGNLLVFYSTVAPYILILVGALLIVGLWTVASAGLACIVLFPLFYGAGMFERSADYVAHRSLYKDGVLLFAAISLLFSGGGMLSLDRILDLNSSGNK